MRDETRDMTDERWSDPAANPTPPINVQYGLCGACCPRSSCESARLGFVENLTTLCVFRALYVLSGDTGMLHMAS